MAQVQPRQKRERVSSAKHSQDRSRPLSGSSNKNVNKLELIENLYGTAKRYGKVGRIGYGLGEDSQYQTLPSKKYKDMQQLHEENMALKKQKNILKKEVDLQKNKTEVFRRRNSQYTKKFNLQFEKEIYWTGSNSNMVMGIKNQYQLMKEKYNLKCKEIEEIQKEYLISRKQQERIYIDALQTDNQILKRKLEEACEEVKILQHGTITSVVEEGLDTHRKMKFELHEINEHLYNKLEMARIDLKEMASTIEAKDKKIQFLDKLLLEKGNAEYAARKKVKKLEREKQEVFDKFSFYKKEKQETLAAMDQRYKKFKVTSEKQIQRQAIIFRKQIEDKTHRIKKLQKQIAYLTTLLSYWKPLDELNEMAASQMPVGKSMVSPADREVVLQYSIGSTMIKFNTSRHQNALPIHIQDDDAKSISRSIIAASRRGSIDINKYLMENRNTSQMMTKSIEMTRLIEGLKRTQITADKRHSQNGVKSRKIHQEEIADICETLRYRFIGHSTPIDDIRDLFDFKEDENDLLTNEEVSWKKEYINMEEVKEILYTNQIFGLNEAQIEMFSRYLVEDSQNDYVYCDPANENLRSIVKSIIKNVVEEYEISEETSNIKRKAEQLMDKYQTNLQSALKITAPKGVISKQKLIQLWTGLGIEMSSDVQDYLIGKIVIQSEGLNHLKYSVLFEK